MGLTTPSPKKYAVQKPNNQQKRKLVVKEAKAHPGL
jgi:hypothetical protein